MVAFVLKHLAIQNYALIDKIVIDFPGGLTIITGETGAGKSILLGALSLIAGERADSSSLNDKTRKCIVEGAFDIKNYSLKQFFSSHELDYSDQTLIRREVSTEGKSRAFINDTPVNLSVLRELTLRLIDIHSQHETLTLNEAEYQLSVVDAFAGTSGAVKKYSSDFFAFKELEKKLADLIELDKQSKLDADYWQFQADEFEKLNLRAGEQEKMEEELKILENAEQIKSVLEKVSFSLNGGEQNILSVLSENKAQLSSISELNSAYRELLSRLGSSYIELKDIANELENLCERITFDPSRAQELTDRLDEIYRLQKKHHVNSVEELLQVKASIDEKLIRNASLESAINKLRSEAEKQRQQLFSQAKAISGARKKCLDSFEKKVTALLTSLAMPNAQFRVEHILLEALTERGIDKVRFLFSANKGSALKEITKVASGGELSRLMLAVKSLIAQNTSMPTIIFDEIDAGVSGGTADQVGKMIAAMAGSHAKGGEGMQVVVITHLPQIASKGNSHFTVFKEVRAGKTFTQIRNLSEEERVIEIAKMLSAGKPTDASVKNARELLKM